LLVDELIVEFSVREGVGVHIEVVDGEDLGQRAVEQANPHPIEVVYFQHFLLELGEVDGLVVVELVGGGEVFALEEVVLVLLVEGEGLLAAIIMGQIEQLLHSGGDEFFEGEEEVGSATEEVSGEIFVLV